MILRTFCVCLIAFAHLAACGDDGVGALSVDLRTDLVLGYELGSTEVEIPSLSRFVRTTTPIEPTLSNTRIARFDELPNGTYAIVVTLYDTGGALIDTQPVQAIRVRGESATTVVYTRGCRNVDCPPPDEPEATACLNRQCVEPLCRPESPLFCESALCEVRDDCAPAAAECAQVECIDGACLDTPIAGACPPEFVCTAEGCLPGVGVIVDAGMPCMPGGECETGNDCEVGEFQCVEDERVCVGTPAPATVVCRASTGACDPRETCDGVSPTCPADASAPAETMCAPDRCDPWTACYCRGRDAKQDQNCFISRCSADGACVERGDTSIVLDCIMGDPPSC